MDTNKDDAEDEEEDDNENVKLYTIPDKEYSRPYTGKFRDDIA